MSEFTQGKWNVIQGAGLDELDVISEDKRGICYLFGYSVYRWNEQRANARLIAAAPEMYERLKLIARLISRQAQGQLRDPIDPAIADSIYELLAEIDDEPVETMKYSSSFFQNRNCEYFPCHDGADPDKFSCLFCFCPLYHMEKCPGTPRTLSNGVKDCFGCKWVHEHYEDVIRVLREDADE